MNMIKFAKFISHFSCRNAIALDEEEITKIAGDIKQCFDQVRVNLTPLFDALANYRKIDAIKEYRDLTGESLLESKNAIERIYHNPVQQS